MTAITVYGYKMHRTELREIQVHIPKGTNITFIPTDFYEVGGAVLVPERESQGFLQLHSFFEAPSNIVLYRANRSGDLRLGVHENALTMSHRNIVEAGDWPGLVKAIEQADPIATSKEHIRLISNRRYALDRRIRDAMLHLMILRAQLERARQSCPHTERSLLEDQEGVTVCLICGMEEPP